MPIPAEDRLIHGVRLVLQENEQEIYRRIYYAGSICSGLLPNGRAKQMRRKKAAMK